MNYILDENHKLVPVKNVLEWAEWYEKSLNRIQKQDFVNEGLFKHIKVSTIFIGCDYMHNDYLSLPPILWETMIFGGQHDGYQERYESYEDAMKGHQKALELVRGY